MTAVVVSQLARCPGCHEPRIVFAHRGVWRFRAHSTGRVDVCAPGRAGDCVGSWQPADVAGVGA